MTAAISKTVSKKGRAISLVNAFGSGALAAYSFLAIFGVFSLILAPWLLFLIALPVVLFVSIETYFVYNDDPYKKTKTLFADFFRIKVFKNKPKHLKKLEEFLLAEFQVGFRQFFTKEQLVELDPYENSKRKLAAYSLGFWTVFPKAVIYGVAAGTLLFFGFLLIPAMPEVVALVLAFVMGTIVGIGHYQVQATKLVVEQKNLFGIASEAEKSSTKIHKLSAVFLSLFALGQAIGQGGGAYTLISKALAAELFQGFFTGDVIMVLAAVGSISVALGTGLFYGRSAMRAPTKDSDFRKAWSNVNKKGKFSASGIAFLALTCKASLSFLGGITLIALAFTPPGWALYTAGGFLAFCTALIQGPEVLKALCNKFAKTKRLMKASQLTDIPKPPSPNNNPSPPSPATTNFISHSPITRKSDHTGKDFRDKNSQHSENSVIVSAPRNDSTFLGFS